MANGEPTYEGMGGGTVGLGWWQGHEAWLQLMHGGTMGVVYGAAGMWQWKLTGDEPGWPEWADAGWSWREALELEGARYVGYVSRVFAGMPFADMAKHPELAEGHMLLAKPGTFYVSYLPEGGTISIEGVPAGLPLRWFDPRRGGPRDRGRRDHRACFQRTQRRPLGAGDRRTDGVAGGPGPARSQSASQSPLRAFSSLRQRWRKG